MKRCNDLEDFHPERMASRILGMGDVQTLIEKLKIGINEDEAKKLQEKNVESNITFWRFFITVKSNKKIRFYKRYTCMLPEEGKLKGLDMSKIDEKQFTYIEAIIQSMTIKERQILI